MKKSTPFKLILFVLLLLVAGFKTARSLPAESQKYLRTILASDGFKSAEIKDEYLKYNFAPLWLNTPNNLVVGIIGNEKRRLQIKLLSAVKDATRADTYLVTGKSKAAGNVCGFSGTFTIRHVRELRNFSTRVDETVSPALHEGILLAEYRLTEDASQKAAGTFTGVLLTNWYIDKKGGLHYDDIRNFADGFSNNQFVGIWTNPKNNKALRCNWGDSRIPNAGSFDIGAGEFSPAYTPGDKEWHRYAQAWIHDNAAAREQESKPWW